MNHLYQKLNSKTHVLAHVIIPTILVLAHISLNTPPTQAYAPTNSPPQCAVPAALNGWDYKAKIKEVWPAWDIDVTNKAVLVYEVWGDSGGTITNTYFQFADSIVFKADNSGSMVVQKNIASTSTPEWPYRDFDATSTGDSMHYQNFYFTSDATETTHYRALGIFNGTPVSVHSNVNVITTYSSTPSLGGVKCISSGINVKYDKSYTGRRYDALPVNNGSIVSTMPCEADWYEVWESIPCAAGRLTSGIANGMTQMAKDIMDGIIAGFSFLFIPDENYMSGLFADQEEFWNNKLGFLVFPVVLMSDIYSEFTDFSGSPCTETNCTYNFGNFFGSNFSVNFSQMHNVSPQLWTFTLLVIRITALYYLINTIYRIGIKIMSSRTL